jgi:nucleotide-binding universal stress UspA family protein
MSYQKVLLAVDDSPMARKAVEHVAALAKEGSVKRVVLVHVSPLIPEERPRWPGEYGEEIPPVKDTDQAGISLVKPKLDFAESVFKEAAVNYEFKFYTGNPAEVICILVEKEIFDLAVIGSRGLNRIEGVIMDSISHHVLLNAKCPVLVFNPSASGLTPADNEYYEF